MTVQEIMDRTGINNLYEAIAYITDSLYEMNEMTGQTVETAFIDIEEDVRLYSLPSDMVKLLQVFRRYDDDGKYVPIPRIQNIDIIQDATASSVTSDDDIVAIPG
jgi:hypothetical protein